MDFWSRLIGGARLGDGKASAASNPQQRLQRFRRHFEQIRSTYDKTPLLQSDSAAAESIRSNLSRLTTILQDESRAPQPHTCLSFVDSANLYTTIGRIGAVAQNEGIIREAAAFFSVLVDSDDEEFLSNRRFARALMTFVDRTCGSGNLYVGEETEGEIIELLFGIAAKIRLEPQLLNVWFSTSGARAPVAGDQGLQNAFVGVTSKEDFPLCYQLIDHVHHEGRMGDFARTGLLYVFETASRSQALEQWIIESDLPTLMASGLGALYSQLSRKLSIIHPQRSLPVILQLSDYLSLAPPVEAESLFSEYLQGHLETFLSYLTFWQDVLEHCTSADVKQTLLDHFQILFLQQLLYPSLLESSDVDGGSSVAVLTYVRQILVTLDHPEFVHLVLQYLLALPQEVGMEMSVVSLSHYAANKRKSLLLLAKTTNEEDDASPDLFNLADLVQSSIRSSNVQTTIAALKLMTILLHKDHKYALNSIINTERPLQESTQRTYGGLNAEVQAYITVAEDIAGETGLDEAYESHVKDAQRHVELHCCSTPLLTLESLGIPSMNALSNANASNATNAPPHALQHGDLFITQILSLVENFLTNNVELNLSLTEVILTLASCPQLRLEDWAAVDPQQYHFTESAPANDDGDLTDLQRLQLARRQPTWSPKATPLLLNTFHRLATNLTSLRPLFPSLSQLINTRKQAFRLHDEISEAIIASPASRPPLPSTPSRNEFPATPTPSRSLGEALQSRLFPGRTADSSPRSDSPRGLSPRGRTPARPDLRVGPTSSPSPGQRAASFFGSPAAGHAGSPARTVSGEARPVVVGHAPEELLSDIIEGANSELLGKKIMFPLQSTGKVQEGDVAEESEVGEEDEEKETGPKIEVSLSHVLTNIVILQEFILELAAVMQVRASLFGEVVFA
ncbi:hypothetical protein BT63DRAFT_449410 [Microthyrium microscopicum]|uniref:FHF complex subunit HOOK-interacting protein C-terminal domain-containing protein n=1 Tax=Microthyrium microscopicum TaxID=703497 RepID=A0A6A6UQ51_9PEZI|nr:hypothetical protein BT63DRAFT_449410 [Microthyrium microscopicum]